MVVTYGGTSIANDTLGSGSAILTALRVRRAQATQPITKIRNAAAGKAARGNTMRSASISTIREHASEAAAAAFIISHESALTNTGALSLTGFSNAILDSNENWFEGVRTFHTYEFSTEPPA